MIVPSVEEEEMPTPFLDTTKPISSTLPRKISSVFDDAFRSIHMMMAKSNEVRNEFRSDQEKLLAGYEKDIDELENKLSELPPTYKLLLKMKAKKKRAEERNKRKNSNIILSNEDSDCDGSVVSASEGANHALNFHLRRDEEKDKCSIFVIPPDDDDDSHKRQKRKSDMSTLTFNKHSSLDSVAKVGVENAKFYSRESMFTTLSNLHNIELRLEEQLNDEGSNTSNLKPSKKNDLMKALERTKIDHCNTVLSIISDYKPQTKTIHGKLRDDVKSSRKLERLGLRVPSVDTMLKLVESECAELFQSEQYSKKDTEEEDGCGINLKSEITDYDHCNKFYGKKISADVRHNSTESEIELHNRQSTHEHPQQTKIASETSHTSQNCERLGSAKLTFNESTEIVLKDTGHLKNIQDLEVKESNPNSLKSIVENNTHRVDPLFPSLDTLRRNNQFENDDYLMPSFQAKRNQCNAPMNYLAATRESKNKMKEKKSTEIVFDDKHDLALENNECKKDSADNLHISGAPNNLRLGNIGAGSDSDNASNSHEGDNSYDDDFSEESENA